MSVPNFRFENGDNVLFKTKNELGVVVARAEHLGGQIKYLVQRGAGVTTWINDELLDVPPPPKPEMDTEAEAAS